MKRDWMKAVGSALLLVAPVGAAAVFLMSAIEVGQATEHHGAADVDGARMAQVTTHDAA